MIISSPTKQFIADHLTDDVRMLALKKQAFSSQNIDFTLAIRQISGRQSIKNKIPSWYENEDILYPEHLPLEQCSSELTARYKASLLRGKTLVDLTGGFGVDCAFMSSNFEKVFYVERQSVLCDSAKNNFNYLNIKYIEVVNADSTAFLNEMPVADCIFIDPARRDEKGKKMIALSDCEPDISLIQNQLLKKSKTALVKLSPMLDITLALQSLPDTTEIHVVSVDNECKELLFLLSSSRADRSSEPLIHCINLSKNKEIQAFQFYKPEEQTTNCIYTSTPGKYLYEPNASILKSGAFKILTQKYPVKKLHQDSHLYTSNQLVQEFPGRIFQIESVFSLHKNDLKLHLQDIFKANIAVRNFPASVDELKKRLGLKDGGEVYLFATTLKNGKKVILRTVKVEC